jgi:hypothetical protein
LLPLVSLLGTALALGTTARMVPAEPCPETHFAPTLCPDICRKPSQEPELHGKRRAC